MNKCPFCGSSNFKPYLELKDWFLTQEPFEIVSCDDCGLLYTTPRPDASKLGCYYKSDEYLSHKENNHGFVPRVYEMVKSVNINFKYSTATKGVKTGRLLDIGCGVGDFLLKAQTNNWDVMGIEPSDEARKISENRLNKKLLTPDDISTLPDSYFDVITLWHVLEHIADLKEELSHLDRMLKHGGRLVLALPNYKSYDATCYKDKWAAWDVPRHLQHFDTETVKMMFANHKYLKINKITRLFWDSFYVSYLSEKYMHHSLPLLRGAFVGCLSNIKALATKQYSSLVYVFEKE